MASATALPTNNSIESESIDELTKEVELLKQKLEEERAKFHDVECNINAIKISKNKINIIFNNFFPVFYF